jgi:predicted DCC family thiol-disulfide oxidoreductase YuxK
MSRATSKNVPLLKVYFDGLCPLCSKEIDYYRTKKGAERSSWLDITATGFDARAEGLDPDKIHAVFHVKTREGAILTGVDAFIEIWKTIPALKSWVTVSGVPGAKPVMKLGYTLFARVRPYLPRLKRHDCDSGVCNPGSRKQ